MMQYIIIQEMLTEVIWRERDSSEWPALLKIPVGGFAGGRGVTGWRASWGEGKGGGNGAGWEKKLGGGKGKKKSGEGE